MKVLGTRLRARYRSDRLQHVTCPLSARFRHAFGDVWESTQPSSDTTSTSPNSQKLALESISFITSAMATPIIVGFGAVAAAFAGRHFLRRAGKGVAEEFVKGGFKSKMDRKEAIAILGLKYVYLPFLPK